MSGDGIIFDGYRAGEVKSVEVKPDPVMGGHSEVRLESWWKGGAFIIHRAVVCECGKRYTGVGNRAFYSFSAHQRVEQAKAKQG